MKCFFIAALSLNAFAAPVFADRHCTAPEPNFTYPNYVQYGPEAENYSKAFALTLSDYFYEYNLRNIEVCEAKGVDYNQNCDALEYGEMGDINPDYLGLTEEEHLAIDDANRLRTAILRERFAACRGDG